VARPFLAAGGSSNVPARALTERGDVVLEGLGPADPRILASVCNSSTSCHLGKFGSRPFVASDF
jgi:hypothetical protein